MRSISGLFLIAGMVVALGSRGGAQAVSAPQVAGQIASDHTGGGSAVVPADSRSEKQKVLATQADKLNSMANELKAQVEMTNKNILSLKVVQKAEEIEFFARRMKDEAKKHS